MELNVGYLLLPGGVTSPYRSDALYRGVDRGWARPTLWDLDSYRKENRTRLANLWQQEFNARYDHGVVLQLDAAMELWEQFRTVGSEVDLIFVRSIYLPDALEPYVDGPKWVDVLERTLPSRMDLHRRIVPPSAFSVIGFDVAWPVSRFYSALCQPGLEEAVKDPAILLNNDGLIGDADVARSVLPATLRKGSGSWPNAVLEVSVPSESRRVNLGERAKSAHS